MDTLRTNLSNMKEECKTSLGYIKIGRNYNEDTRDLVSSFLTNAAQRILSMDIVMSRVEAQYMNFLSWLGIPNHFHKVVIIFTKIDIMIESRLLGLSSTKNCNNSVNIFQRSCGDQETNIRRNSQGTEERRENEEIQSPETIKKFWFEQKFELG